MALFLLRKYFEFLYHHIYEFDSSASDCSCLGYIMHVHEPYCIFTFNGLGAFIEQNEQIRFSLKPQKPKRQ